jgi:hypothetical protein
VGEGVLPHQVDGSGIVAKREGTLVGLAASRGVAGRKGEETPKRTEDMRE